MADNFIANAGAGGDTFGADDIAGVKYPRSKVGFGADGSYTDASEVAPLPTAATGAPTGYWPGYVPPTGVDNKSLVFDEGGAAVTRAVTLTDEGTFRANFSNTSLAVSVGSVTVSGDTVTGSGFYSTDVHLKDYFKLDADPESAWTQIISMDSDTQFTLASAYPGGASGAASRVVVKPVTGSGGTIAIASGRATLSSGTTNNAVTALSRKLDYLPIIFRNALSVSQRIANQTIFAGMQEDSFTPRWFARFRFEGTSNTVVICETGRNATGAPSASELEQVTVTLPDGLTTAASLEFTVELLAESCKFYVNNKAVREAKPILLAELSKVIPIQSDIVAAGISIVNGTGAASNTDVVIDYITGQNHNVLKASYFSNTESVIAATPPISEFTGTLSNVGTILTVDCSQFRQLSFSVQGTNTGTVAFEASDEPTFAAPIPVFCLPASGGATASSTNTLAKAGFLAPIVARYFRLRTSSGASATRTVIVQGYQEVTFSPSQQVTLVTGQAISTTTSALLSGGVINTRIISANNTTGISVKASAGCVNAITLENLSAAVRFVKVYSKATAPTVGTDTPIFTYLLPAGSSRAIECGTGLRIATGIGIGITTGYLDSDTGAPAVGDVIVNISYT
jgi:hypothetical protein